MRDMKNWKQTKHLYIQDHLSQSFKQPERRPNALKAIEKVFKEKFPELLKDENIFQNISKMYLIKLYECLKGRVVNGAEKSVFTGLYKFSK